MPTVDFASLRGQMAGEDCLIVACGPSAHAVARGVWRRFWTMACNRAVTFCDADYGMCIEPQHNNCWKVMRAHPLPLVFSHIAENQKGILPVPRLSRFSSENARRIIDPEGCEAKPSLRYGMSPFFAAAVAAHLGFETIGLIGVDVTDDRWGHSETYRANEAWRLLHEDLAEHGHRLINLNPDSRLTTVPAAPWSELRCKMAG